MTQISQRLWMVAAITALPMMAGCLVTSKNEVSETGMRVSESTLANVEPGQTTGDWLVATIGEPTARSPVADEPAREIWRYDHVRTERSAGSLFLIFGGSSARTQSSRVFFELENNVVRRSWQEA